MKRGSTDAETCRLNGWGPGTRLIGEERGRSATITITAIGRACVLAVRDGWSTESVWSLEYREWRRELTGPPDVYATMVRKLTAPPDPIDPMAQEIASPEHTGGALRRRTRRSRRGGG